MTNRGEESGLVWFGVELFDGPFFRVFVPGFGKEKQGCCYELSYEVDYVEGSDKECCLVVRGRTTTI